MAPGFTTLPPELLLLIGSFLDRRSLHRLVKCSRNLYNYLNPTLWSLMNPTTTLLWATDLRAWSVAAYALLHNPDLTLRGFQGYTALHFAANHGHEPTVVALLDAGADLSVGGIYGHTPLLLAVSGGHLGVVKILLDRGASTWGAMLECSSWDLRMAKLLLERGANVDGERTGTRNETPLVRAIKAGKGRMARLLYKWGADANIKDKQGRTARDLASIYGIGLVSRKDDKK